jgi:hypothetical protein
MSKTKLTPKEQKFAELCVELGNQTEAYRQVYKPSNESADWIKVEASKIKKKLIEPITQLRDKGIIELKPMPKPTKGYIYILHIDGFNYYKVGISQNVPSRKKAIQTLVPFDIETIRVINVEGYRNIEKEIHNELNEYRYKGEWFNCDIDIINKIFDRYDS